MAENVPRVARPPHGRDWLIKFLTQLIKSPKPDMNKLGTAATVTPESEPLCVARRPES
jgi:hypothetical protein